MIQFQKSRMQLGMQHKSQFRKFRPYRILKKLHDNAYVIDLPEELQISTTFDVADIFGYQPPNLAMVRVSENFESNSSLEEGNNAEHPVVIH